MKEEACEVTAMKLAASLARRIERRTYSRGEAKPCTVNGTKLRDFKLVAENEAL